MKNENLSHPNTSICLSASALSLSLSLESRISAILALLITYLDNTLCVSGNEQLTIFLHVYQQANN